MMDENLKTVNKDDVPTNIINVWSDHEMADVLRQASLLIGTTVDGDCELQCTAANSGAMRTILAAMRVFPQHGPLQKWSCYAIFNLSYGNAANKVELVKRGGLQQVLKTMSQHESDLEVQRLAMAILFSTLQSNSEEQAADGENKKQEIDVYAMRAIALSNGMVDVIRQVMQAHQAKKEIQLMGTQLLIVTTSPALDLPSSMDVADDEADKEALVQAVNSISSNSNDKSNDQSIPHTEDSTPGGGIQLPTSPSCDMSLPLSPVPAF